MNPEQCRAARGWLGWTQQELARRAGVGLSTVRDFENGDRTPIPNNRAAITRAIEEAGIRLSLMTMARLSVLRLTASPPKTTAGLPDHHALETLAGVVARSYRDHPTVGTTSLFAQRVYPSVAGRCSP